MRWKWIIVACSAGALVITFWALWPRSHDLSRISQQIHQIPGYLLRDYWLSENEILLAPEPGSRPHFEIRKWNVDSGTLFVLPGPSEALQESQRRGPCLFMYYWHLSKDRKWLLWTENPHRGPSRFVAVELEGIGIRIWPQKPKTTTEFDDFVLWNAEGRNWLRFVRTAQRPESTEIVEFSMVSSTPRRLSLVPSTTGMISRLWRLPNGMVAKLRQPVDGAVEVTEYDLSHPGAKPTKCSLKVRPNVRMCEPALSPHGDRIAWLVFWREPAPGPPALQSLMKWLGLRARSRMALLISDLRGKELQEIGVLVDPPAQYISKLAWSPSGTRISFSIGNTLWVVPAR